MLPSALVCVDIYIFMYISSIKTREGAAAACGVFPSLSQHRESEERTTHARKSTAEAEQPPFTF